tara:strand:- start:1891 stop:2295 length:405 start_codon:yes stop_codon:yes gene_type:complete
MQKIIDSIKKHEGYRATVYKCTQDYDTIGYGFAIKDLKLSKKVCDLILQENLDILIPRIKDKIAWYDNAPEDLQMVLVNMVYQIGLSGVLKFRKTLAAMQVQDWDKAADEMLDSLWARQTSTRANELADIVRSL